MRILPILFNTEMVRGILEERKSVTRRVIRGVETIWSFQGMERDPAVFRVRADGEACPKTVKGQYATFEADPGVWFPIFKAPYEPGDVLYVRETWGDYATYTNPDGADYFMYRADYPDGATTTTYPDGTVFDLPNWKPSIHMPKEAARIFLKVKAVRVERLHDITEEQAVAEGARFTDFGEYTPPWKMSVDGGKTFHEAKSIHHPGYHFKDAYRPDQCFEFARSAFANYWGSTIKPADRDKYGWYANPWVWVIEFERTYKPEGWPHGKA